MKDNKETESDNIVVGARASDVSAAMVNPHHLRILLKGADPWNTWRDQNQDIVPDLNGVDLREQAIAGRELASGPKFTKRFSHGANLRCANLRQAKLVGAQLQRATLVGAHMEGADLSDANLTDACLVSAHLSDANLSGANLNRCDLSSTNLSRTRGLTDEQLATAIGNFQTVRLPYNIRKIPNHWTECRDDVVPVFDLGDLDPSIIAALSKSTDLRTSSKYAIGRKWRAIFPAGSMRAYTRDLAAEVRKKSQSSIAGGLIGLAVIVISELLSRSVLGAGWLSHAIELIAKLANKSPY